MPALCAATMLALTSVSLGLDRSTKPSVASHDCAALRHSVERVPDWYSVECLGKPSSPSGPRAARPLGGDLAYVKNNNATGTNLPNSVDTVILPSTSYTLAGPQPRPIYAMDFDHSAGTLWAIDDSTHEFGTINLNDGFFTSVGIVTGLGAGQVTTGLKFDPTSSVIYLSATDGVTGDLYTLDPGNVATLVGPTAGFPMIIDIAISNTGQMYGHDIGASMLVSIDKATGATTAIGPTGVSCNFAQGMDFDPNTNVLYAWLYFANGTSHLGTFDLATGAATVVADGVDEELEGAVRVAALDITPTALSVDATGNRVFDPNEIVSVIPTWQNTGALPLNVTSTLSNFTGPGTGSDPVYTIVDGSGGYGTINPGATAACVDCYSLGLATMVRPAQHWDATVDETLSPTSTIKTWTLHVGNSFTDVSTDIVADPYYPFIETIFHKGVTAGCMLGDTFCPMQNNLRQEMAVFLLKASQGAGYAPPSCTPPGVFSDVPCPGPYTDWIEDLSVRGVTAGCSSDPGPPPTVQYCPDRDILRQEMAVFLLRMSQGSGYTPPACTPPGIFSDVPCPGLYTDWIEDLSTRGITVGCSSNPGPPPTIQFCPTNKVTRQEMAVFLTKTFSLVLYGP